MASVRYVSVSVHIPGMCLWPYFTGKQLEPFSLKNSRLLKGSVTTKNNNECKQCSYHVLYSLFMHNSVT